MSNLILRRPVKSAGPAMKIIHQTLLLLIVAVSSAAARESAANPPRDSKTANARLRGPLSAEGVLVETDSSEAGGEEGRFETGAPEFLEEARCIATGNNCKKDIKGVKGGGCCSNQCWGTKGLKGGKCSCSEKGQLCNLDVNCCPGAGLSCVKSTNIEGQTDGYKYCTAD